MVFDLGDQEGEIQYIGGPMDGKRHRENWDGACGGPSIDVVRVKYTPFGCDPDEEGQWHQYEFRCSCFPDHNGEMVELWGFYHCPEQSS